MDCGSTISALPRHDSQRCCDHRSEILCTLAQSTWEPKYQEIFGCICRYLKCLFLFIYFQCFLYFFYIFFYYYYHYFFYHYYHHINIIMIYYHHYYLYNYYMLPTMSTFHFLSQLCRNCLWLLFFNFDLIMMERSWYIFHAIFFFSSSSTSHINYYKINQL